MAIYLKASSSNISFDKKYDYEEIRFFKVVYAGILYQKPIHLNSMIIHDFTLLARFNHCYIALPQKLAQNY